MAEEVTVGTGAVVVAEPDVHISNQGSIVMITPITDAAKAWVEENLELEGWQWFGDAFAVEPRYAADLMDGMVNDGLEVG